MGSLRRERPMPPITEITSCPNCGSVLKPDLDYCRTCRLEVSRMAGYHTRRNIAMGVKIATLAVLLATVVGLGYHWFGPKPPRYLKYPGTAQAAADEFLKDVSGGDAT